MKKNIFTKTLAVGALFFAISAQAEENYVTKYSCTNFDGSTLTVFHDVQTKESKKAIVHLQNSTTGGLKVYATVYEPLKLGLGETEAYEYKIYEGQNEVGLIKVKTQQKVGRGGGFCGRAACDIGSPLVPVYSTYASLKFGEYEDSFNCN